jgi:hypothetical protein
MKMQTFLPYPDYRSSLRCLDDKRLGKQRVEAYQILCTLTGASSGWQNHPAVLMWKGYVNALRFYMNIAIEEWENRGFQNSMQMQRVNLPSGFAGYFPNQDSLQYYGMLPPFSDAFHASHRSNLLRKDPSFYFKYGWTEPNNLPYVWPTHSNVRKGV